MGRRRGGYCCATRRRWGGQICLLQVCAHFFPFFPLIHLFCFCFFFFFIICLLLLLFFRLLVLQICVRLLDGCVRLLRGFAVRSVLLKFFARLQELSLFCLVLLFLFFFLLLLLLLLFVMPKSFLPIFVSLLFILFFLLKALLRVPFRTFLLLGSACTRGVQREL